MLTAGWVMESLCAARVRLRSAMTSSKTRRRFKSKERKFKGPMVFIIVVNINDSTYKFEWIRGKP
ncbi:hypothetical protein D3C72_2007910 [compost metagenome]